MILPRRARDKHRKTKGVFCAKVVAAFASESLLASLRSGKKECEQRAAAYGLSVGGPSVVAPLLATISELLADDLSWLQVSERSHLR